MNMNVYGGFTMQEKRRYKRLPIKLQLEISELFKQDNEVIKDLDAAIEVFDISKAGIGFTSQSYIPEGYYFNATIVMENSDQKILTVVRTLHRTSLNDNLYRYGCEFTGMAGIFDSVFEDYEKSIEQ